MDNNTILITDEIRLAKFVAELERQGIVYYVDTRDNQYFISIKGF